MSVQQLLLDMRSCGCTPRIAAGLAMTPAAQAAAVPHLSPLAPPFPHHLQFCGEAINSRSGRKRSTYTSKELRKDMEVFLETGVHPHLQRVQQDAGSSDVLTALPDPDPSRPHVFMDITVDNKPAGAYHSCLAKLEQQQ